jgi:hypothetical protein
MGVTRFDLPYARSLSGLISPCTKLMGMISFVLLTRHEARVETPLCFLHFARSLCGERARAERDVDHSGYEP